MLKCDKMNIEFSIKGKSNSEIVSLVGDKLNELYGNNYGSKFLKMNAFELYNNGILSAGSLLEEYVPDKNEVIENLINRCNIIRFEFEHGDNCVVIIYKFLINKSMGIFYIREQKQVIHPMLVDDMYEKMY